MKLKNYLANLNQMVKDNPELLELDVVYSKDDEGNAFHEVHYSPTLGKHEDWDFLEYNPKAEDPEDSCEEEEINSICIN